MKKNLIHLLLTLFISLNSFAQLSFHHQHYSVQDGLSENNISVIFQDSRGFMWFGTYNGLNKFDGYNFTQYKTLTTAADQDILENDHITRIVEDIWGYLWIITYDDKAYRFNTATEKFTSVARLFTQEAPEDESNERAGSAAPAVSHVYALPNGDVWLSARGGGVVLARTDPETHDIEVILHKDGDGFNGGEIKDILSAPDGASLLLTSRGLTRFDNDGGTFRQLVPDNILKQNILPFSVSEKGKELLVGMTDGSIYLHSSVNSSFTKIAQPFNGEVTSIEFLDSARYVAYYHRHGLVVGNAYSRKITTYNIPEREKSRLSTKPRLYIDQYGEVWINTGNAWVLHLNPVTDKMEWLTLPAYHVEGFTTESEFFETADGLLFVRLWGNRGCYYNRGEGRLEPLIPEMENSPFSNNISRWLPDRQGNIWIFTYRNKEIDKISIEKRVRLLRLVEDDRYEQNDIQCLFIDSQSRIWIGTKEGRICIMNPQHEVVGYLNRDGGISSRGEIWPKVYSIAEDNDGHIWFGTREQGLFHLREHNARFTVTSHIPQSRIEGNPGCRNVFFLHRDISGRIWVGTWGGGIWCIEKDHGGNPRFTQAGATDETYPFGLFGRVRHIASDSKNRIWCATPSGVLSFPAHPDSLAQLRYTTLTATHGGTVHLPVNNVNSIISTNNDVIYIGTTGGGMYRILMDATGNVETKSYSSLNGFPADIIYSMIEDNAGQLWIATHKGIVRFNMLTEESELFGNDHYHPYNLTSNTVGVATDGTFLMGANKGIVAYNPALMEQDRYVPPLYFTNLQLFHRDVQPGDGSGILTHPLEQTTAITLNHKQTVFTIGFAALDFRNPEKIRYRYMLEGFDKDWNESGPSRTASYTNLPAGSYTFKVRSTNSDGAWGGENELSLTVLPPFWKTPLAYIIYFFAALAMIFTISYVMYTVYRLKHSIRVDKEIMRIFTNISHEIRTPLTLVHTPLEHILRTRKVDRETGEELEIVYRNSGRLLQLVNQILDFRKIQHNRMPLVVHPLDISAFLNDLVKNFQPLAEQKHVSLRFSSNCPDLKINTDREKIETIFYNIISNSLKYTPAGKSIYVDIIRHDDSLTFKVQDEGVGIAKDRMNKLFVPFESGDAGPNDIQPGTGIGLALVKELCNLLGMEISFLSQSGSGTTVVLKTHITPVNPDQLIYNQQPNTIPVAEPGDNPVDSEESIGEEEENGRSKILVVEDNDELRNFLRRILSPDYEVFEAANGKQAMQVAQERLPDLIISDLMMPEMDGAAFAEKLKLDIKTSHVPIMILTAKNDVQSETQLFSLGVDAFIRKPFNAEVLMTRVASILQQRERLHAIYSSSLLAITSHKKKEDNTSEKDQECLDTLMEYMNEHISASDITVDDLCSVTGFTYSLLYKKLKILIGLSPLEFIKEFRIQRAAELILDGKYSMKEIAYMVGFSDSRYFSRCFKQKYGVTPSEYKSSAQNTDNQ